MNVRDMVTPYLSPVVQLDIGCTIFNDLSASGHFTNEQIVYIEDAVTDFVFPIHTSTYEANCPVTY
jgi:hypothetical protein